MRSKILKLGFSGFVGKLTKRKRTRKQRGFGLMETALAFGLATLLAASAVEYMGESARTARAAAVAGKLAEVYKAADLMVAEYFDDLIDAAGSGSPVVIPVGRGTASEAVPSGPGSLPSLQEAGFLSDSYIDRNSYNQRHVVLVRQPDSSQDRLSVLITTWGGLDIEDAQLAKIIGYIGARGGAMLDRRPTGTPANTVMGAYGGWQTPAGTWSANWSGNAVGPSVGHAMVHFAMSRDERGVRVNEFLHRESIDGASHLNEMNTDLGLGNNDITNINNFDSRNGRIGQDLEIDRDLYVGNNVEITNNLEIGRDLVVARDIEAGRHLRSGMDVNAGRHLNVTTDGRIGRDLSVTRDADIDRHLNVDGQSTLLGRTTVGDTAGARNLKLHVRNGHVSIDNTLFLGESSDVAEAPDIRMTGQGLIASQGHLNLTTNNAGSNIQFRSGGFTTTTSSPTFTSYGTGDARVHRDLDVDRDLDITRNAVIGNNLNVTNQIRASDVYIENIGRWASEGVYYANIVAPGNNVPRPSCGSRSPQIFVSPVIYSDNGQGRPILGVRAYADVSGSNWRPRMTVYVPNAAGTGATTVNVNSSYGRIMVLAKCS